jgi:hypothetical protein
MRQAELETRELRRSEGRGSVVDPVTDDGQWEWSNRARLLLGGATRGMLVGKLPQVG